jgi:hypothetical protein
VWVLVDADPPIDVPAGARVTVEGEPYGDGW